MSKYRKREKLKEGEGKLYQVRMNVGEAYTQPERKKIWTMGIDERGGYWTRLLRAKNREDAVDYLLSNNRRQKNPKVIDQTWSQVDLMSIEQ